MRGSFVIAFLASGCFSMNTFETARTVDEGTFAHSFSLTSYVHPERQNVPVPMPAYSLHWGALEGLELGALAGTPGHLRFFAKYNPIRTEWFDASIALGLWFGYRPHDVMGEDHALLLGGDLPLLLDLNLGPVTIVPFAGPGLVYSPTGKTGGVIVRTGIGVRFPFGKHVRLHPELSTIVDPYRGEPVDYAIGIGILVGNDPHRDPFQREPE